MFILMHLHDCQFKYEVEEGTFLLVTRLDISKGPIGAPVLTVHVHNVDKPYVHFLDSDLPKELQIAKLNRFHIIIPDKNFSPLELRKTKDMILDHLGHDLSDEKNVVITSNGELYDPAEDIIGETGFTASCLADLEEALMLIAQRAPLIAWSLPANIYDINDETEAQQEYVRDDPSKLWYPSKEAAEQALNFKIEVRLQMAAHDSQTLNHIKSW